MHVPFGIFMQSRTGRTGGLGGQYSYLELHTGGLQFFSPNTAQGGREVKAGMLGMEFWIKISLNLRLIAVCI